MTVNKTDMDKLRLITDLQNMVRMTEELYLLGNRLIHHLKTAPHPDYRDGCARCVMHRLYYQRMTDDLNRRRRHIAIHLARDPQHK